MLLFKLLLGLVPAVLSAQVVGASLSGVVTDSSHGGIPQATVTVRNLENGAERRLLTDSSGRYFAPSIAVGTYSSPQGSRALHRNRNRESTW